MEWLQNHPFLTTFGILLLLALYHPLNKRPARAYHKSKIDDAIPLSPLWLYPYVAYYPFIAIAFISLPHTQYWIEFVISYVLGSIAALVIWYVYPTGVRRPDNLVGKHLHHTILRHLYTHDRDTNAIPSGHVLHTGIAAYYLVFAYPHAALWTIAASVLITFSTVFTKQHYVIDIPTAIVVSVAAIYIGGIIV